METTQSTNLTGWRKEGEREGEEGGKGKNGPSSHIAHLSFRCCRYFLGFSLFCSSRPFSPSPRPFSFSPLLLASSQPSTSPQPPLVGLPFPSHSPFPSPLPSLLPITSHHLTSSRSPKMQNAYARRYGESPLPGMIAVDQATTISTATTTTTTGGTPPQVQYGISKLNTAAHVSK